MELGIRGRIALVTGGSYGIGRAIALALAAEGCRVAVCGRTQSHLDAAVAEIKSKGGEALGIAADVLKADDITRVVTTVTSTWNTLEILVNNVGGGGGRVATPVEKVPEERWVETYNRNAMAAIRFTRLAIPHMRQRKWGRVVTVASLQGREGGGRPWYTIAKSAEISLMKTLAMDHALAREGLTFNSIAPGRVLFEGNDWDQFRRENVLKFEEAVRTNVPVERIGTPEEIASVVTFVCSKNSGYLNGACIPIDGGESKSF